MSLENQSEIPEGHPPYEDPLAFVAPWFERETVPEHLFLTMQAYFNRHQSIQPHLMALLEGNTELAKTLSPEEDRPYLDIVKKLYEFYVEKRAFGSLERVSAWISDPTDGCVPIGGLSKPAVLAALYNAAIPIGNGVYQYNRELMTEQTARLEFVSSDRFDFDYVQGRRLKVDLAGDWLNPKRYDEGYGHGTAARVIAALRFEGPTSNSILLEHHIGLVTEAAHHDIMVETSQEDPGLTSAGRALLNALQESARYIEEDK
jgi:hypothetical protein